MKRLTTGEMGPLTSGRLIPAVLLAIGAGWPTSAAAATISTYTVAQQPACCGTPSNVNWYAYNGQFSTYFDNGTLRHVNEVPVAKTVQSAITGTNGVKGDALVNFDITRGTIGALVSTGIGNDGYSATSARASVTLAENLTFRIAGATTSTRTPIALVFDWHGSFAGDRSGNGAQAYFSAGAGESRLSASRFGSGYFSSSSNTYVVGDGGDRYQFTLLYDLIGSEVVLPVFASMDLHATGGQIADFSRTAGVSLRLPDTVSYTSASGIFLSAIAAVPEPTTWITMLMGFGLVGAAMRSTRRQMAL